MDSGDIARLYGKKTQDILVHMQHVSRKEAYDSVHRHCFLDVKDISNMVVIKTEALGEPVWSRCYIA